MEERMPSEAGDRDCSVAFTSQEIPTNTGTHQELGKGKGGFFPRIFRGITGLQIPLAFRTVIK